MFQLTHDGDIDIATAKHFSDPYITKTVKWSILLERLSQSVRTTETHLQYLNLDKKKQARIKDIGGFVGGFLNGKQRLKKNMTSRQLLTLDIDNGVVDQFKQFKEHYQCASCIYSTHSHSLETPSYRIVIPLSRPVEIDEFEAISRKICDSLGMIHFCKTSFIPHQVMFWPSCCQDIDPVFDYQDGLWLDPDRILEWYEDWTDIRTWSGIEAIDFKKAFQDGRMQEDPLVKEGIIGAFCRAYTITEAITAFLPDKYEPVEGVDDRFTYTAGSTAAGLIIYEDKWTYSHHSTDPCSERLCNAFDLVRIHKFGLLDEKIKASAKSRDYPSYKAMEKWLPDEPLTKAILIREKAETLKMEFGSAESDIKIEMSDQKTNECSTWKEKLKIDKYGMPLDTRANIRIIFREDPELKDVFCFDEFGFIRQVLKKLAWHKAPVPRTFQDSDRADLRWYFQTFYGIKNAGALDDELEKVFDDHRYHPVKQYLEGLVWDGQPRLETLFIDYLGAPDSVYMRTITRKSLTGAIARIYRPGIKFDYVTVFLGNQGMGKSYLLNYLGGQWYSDTMAAIHNIQRAAESMFGKWIIEIAEMSQFRKSEVQAVKAFVSSPADTFRPAYGREVVTNKRQCVFFATTNDFDFIKDQTGGRRFWPVDIRYGFPKFNVFALTPEIRNQIWAEAKMYYLLGDKLYLEPEMEKEASAIQEIHTERDDRLDLIEHYLKMSLPDDWDNRDIFRQREYYRDELAEKGAIERNVITVHEIWCIFLGQETNTMTSRNTDFIHHFLRKLKGWKQFEHKQRNKKFGMVRTYFKK